MHGEIQRDGVTSGDIQMNAAGTTNARRYRD